MPWIEIVQLDPPDRAQRALDRCPVPVDLVEPGARDAFVISYGRRASVKTGMGVETAADHDLVRGNRFGGRPRGHDGRQRLVDGLLQWLPAILAQGIEREVEWHPLGERGGRELRGRRGCTGQAESHIAQV